MTGGRFSLARWMLPLAQACVNGGEVVMRCHLGGLVEIVRADPEAHFTHELISHADQPWLKVDGDLITIIGIDSGVQYRIVDCDDAGCDCFMRGCVKAVRVR